MKQDISQLTQILQFFRFSVSPAILSCQPPMPTRPTHSPLDQSDANSALVRRCLAGESRAWDELVSCYSPLVYSIAARAGLPRELRDDVFQNTFVAIVKHLHSLRDGRALTKWIITTATRESWRVSKKRLINNSTYELQTLEPDQLVQLERAQAVEIGLRELGGQCEKLLRALFAGRQDPDYRTIAEALGIPVGSIGPTRQRCLAKLADLLGPQIGL